MKTYQNNHHHKQLLLILTLSINACKPRENCITSAELGKCDARYVKTEIHTAYFNCYPLGEAAKKECTGKLVAQYIQKHRQQDQEYVQSYQFESEKLGFRNFLNSHKLPCETINEGPIFNEDKKAYLVTCQPKWQYLMRFDYNRKEWHLIQREITHD